LFLIIGLIGVLGSVFGGFMISGGRVGMLLHPVELLVIFGAGISSMLIGTPVKKLKSISSELPKIFKGPKYTPENYRDILIFLSAFLKVVKSKGFLAVEAHIENPLESSLFMKYPGFMSDKSLRTFTQEYLRLISMGVENPHQVEDLIDNEMEAILQPSKESAKIIAVLADALPALGIVAAVMGVILAMGAISEPPEVLGSLIGAALAGTLLGVFASYGIVSPIANQITAIGEADMHMYKCIHSVLIAYLEGYSPAIALEFGRKLLPFSYRPGFSELENAIAEEVASSREV
jgi:chemotaxis protein MotA